MYRIVSLFCFLFFLVSESLSQPLCRIEEFTTRDGLSQRMISQILQDKQGFMWFSTWNGMTRFDNYSLIGYKTSRNPDYPLSNTRINYISESATGNIWCGTNDYRAYLFDRQTENYVDVLAPLEVEMKRRYPVRLVYSLPKGVTWILCEQGYAFRVEDSRYREKEGIVSYNTFDGNLPGNYVYHVMQDRDGDEWILTDGGTFVHGAKNVRSSIPFMYGQDAEDGVLLVSGDGVIARYDYARNELLFPDVKLPVTTVNTIRLYSDSILALGTANGLFLYNWKENTLQHFDVSANPVSNEIFYIEKESGGALWLFTGAEGVVRLDPRTGKAKHLIGADGERSENQPSHVFFMYEDRGGTVWVLPRSGVFGYYDPETDMIRKLEVGSDEHRYEYTPLIRHCYPDRQGNLWLAASGGIAKLSFFKEHISYVDVDRGAEARSFMTDHQGRLWVGTKGGKVKVFEPDGTLCGYLSPQGIFQKEETTLTRSSGVYTITEDPAHNIWIGTRGDGIYLLHAPDNQGRSRLEHYRANASDPFSLSSDEIYTIYHDERGNTWIGSFVGGLNLVDKHSPKLRFLHHGNILKGYPQGDFPDIRFITGDSSVLLIGTTQGLITFSGEFERPEAIRFYINRGNKRDSARLNGNNVMHIFQDSRRDWYTVTFDGGFQQIASENLLSDSIRFSRFIPPGANALPDRALSLFEDDRGFLWIVCEDGVTRFDRESGHFEQFNRDYLMQDHYFAEAISARTTGGAYALGSEVGMMLFSPERMNKSDYVPPMVFTDIEVQGADSITRDASGRIILEKNQRNISLRFAALDYSGVSGIRYAYRLEGLENEWKYADERSVSYVNLPKGEYRFLVRSTNSDGVWVENIAGLSIFVQPKFSETIWAWLLYGFLLILVVLALLYVLFYIYRLRYRVGMEQQLADVKLRFFTDVAHELRTPITLISSPVSEVLEHENLSPTARNYLGLVQNNIARMLRLINEILDFRKIQNKKMKLLVEKLELKGMVEGIMEDFRLVADEKNMDFRLDSPASPVEYWGDREKTEKILFNLLSNAFKFTPSGRSIGLRIEEQPDELWVTVSDTGIGIPSENLPSLFQRFVNFSSYNSIQPSSGIGLSLAKELLELHHAEIDVSSEEGVGSQFRIRFKKGRAHFKADDYVDFILNDIHTGNMASGFPDVPEEMEADDESPLTVLVVEDNAELRSFLTSVLSRSYRIITASNGQEGLEKVFSELPDFILTDVMMPEMDGLEMVRAIKESPDVCHIPIVVLSARSSIEDQIEGLEYGIDDYITKPFSSSYLKTRVESLIRQRQELQQQFMSSISDTDGRRFSFTPSEPNIIPFDHSFMERLLEFMERNMDNAQLAVDDIAEAMDVSRSILYRKLKTITGCSPVDFIREIRIKRAVQLIETGEFTFSQIAYMTGFNDPKYFGKCFKKQTGMNPTEYKIHTRPDQSKTDELNSC